MDKGAGVRLGTTDGNNGIRFALTMDKTEYDSLMEKVGTEENDFNDPAIAAALAIRGSKVSVGIFGILICDSAHGMTMQANRFKGIRAAHCDSVESAKLAREHDDANVLCLSAHFMNEKTMEKIAEAFINTKFEALERRLKRINRLDERKDYD